MKEKRNYFNIYDGNIIFIVFFIVMAIIQAIVGSILNANNIGNNNQYYTIIMLAVNQASMLIAFFSYTGIKKINFIQACKFDKKISYKQVLLILAITISALLAFLPIAKLFVYLLGLCGFNVSKASNFIVPNGAGGIVLMVIFAVIMPAFVEELIYRGAIVQGFKQKSYIFAIFASSLLFSLGHGSAVQTVHQFLLACVIALVVLSGNSIWYGILIHLFNNAIGFGLSFVKIPQLSAGYSALIYICSFIIGMIALVGFLKWFIKNAKDIKNGTDKVVDVYPKGKLHYALSSTIDTFVDVLRMMVNKQERARCKEEFEGVVGFLDDDYDKQSSVFGKMKKAPLIYWINVLVVLVMWIVNFVMGFNV